MKRKDLKDPRNSWQKFSDQMYGAPEYTLILLNNQIVKVLEGLNSIEDKNWRIKDLIGTLQESYQHPNNGFFKTTERLVP